MILRIAHRGASAYAPENTLKAFEKAIAMKADMIEIDVQNCKNDVAVIHDDTLERTTDGKGSVYGKTMNELKKLDAGEGEKIPSLSEAFDLIKERAKVNIEIKEKCGVKSVLNIIEKYVKEREWRYGSFLISSFEHSKLVEMHMLNPKMRLGILFREVFPGLWGLAEKINAYSINFPFKIATRDIIKAAHKKI